MSSVRRQLTLWASQYADMVSVHRKTENERESNQSTFPTDSPKDENESLDALKLREIPELDVKSIRELIEDVSHRRISKRGPVSVDSVDADGLSSCFSCDLSLLSMTEPSPAQKEKDRRTLKMQPASMKPRLDQNVFVRRNGSSEVASPPPQHSGRSSRSWSRGKAPVKNKNSALAEGAKYIRELEVAIPAARGVSTASVASSGIKGRRPVEVDKLGPVSVDSVSSSSCCSELETCEDVAAAIVEPYVNPALATSQPMNTLAKLTMPNLDKLTTIAEQMDTEEILKAEIAAFLRRAPAPAVREEMNLGDPRAIKALDSKQKVRGDIIDHLKRASATLGEKPGSEQAAITETKATTVKEAVKSAHGTSTSHVSRQTPSENIGPIAASQPKGRSKGPISVDSVDDLSTSCSEASVRENGPDRSAEHLNELMKQYDLAMPLATNPYYSPRKVTGSDGSPDLTLSTSSDDSKLNADAQLLPLTTGSKTDVVRATPNLSMKPTFGTQVTTTGNLKTASTPSMVASAEKEVQHRAESEQRSARVASSLTANVIAPSGFATTMMTKDESVKDGDPSFSGSAVKQGEVPPKTILDDQLQKSQGAKQQNTSSTQRPSSSESAKPPTNKTEASESKELQKSDGKSQTKEESPKKPFNIRASSIAKEPKPARSSIRDSGDDSLVPVVDNPKVRFKEAQTSVDTPTEDSVSSVYLSSCMSELSMEDPVLKLVNGTKKEVPVSTTRNHQRTAQLAPNTLISPTTGFVPPAYIYFRRPLVEEVENAATYIEI